MILLLPSISAHLHVLVYLRSVFGYVLLFVGLRIFLSHSTLFPKQSAGAGAHLTCAWGNWLIAVIHLQWPSVGFRAGSHAVAEAALVAAVVVAACGRTGSKAAVAVAACGCTVMNGVIQLVW